MSSGNSWSYLSFNQDVSTSEGRLPEAIAAQVLRYLLCCTRCLLLTCDFKSLQPAQDSCKTNCEGLKLLLDTAHVGRSLRGEASMGQITTGDHEWSWDPRLKTEWQQHEVDLWV